MQSWEDKFRSWAGPPSQAEQERTDRTVEEIRRAISSDPMLQRRNVSVIGQGSYKNNTNVRRDSDVDVGVVCYDTFLWNGPAGTNNETFGIEPATYHYSQYKNEVQQALVNWFGTQAVRRGNKAFDIKSGSRGVEADVAPFFEHRTYLPDRKYLSGVELRPDSGIPERVINWPEQHYANGVAKNNATGRRYKSLVRVLKNIRNEMDESGIKAAAPIIGFLTECLLWSVPNYNFGHNMYSDDLRSALQYMYHHTKDDIAGAKLLEVSERKFLFDYAQKWTREQAHEFVDSAWNYVGL
jgi:hypothetical protein